MVIELVRGDQWLNGIDRIQHGKQHTNIIVHNCLDDSKHLAVPCCSWDYLIDSNYSDMRAAYRCHQSPWEQSCSRRVFAEITSKAIAPTKTRHIKVKASHAEREEECHASAIVPTYGGGEWLASIVGPDIKKERPQLDFAPPCPQ
mmetsp:Transcript_107249/g.334314  ORF Transcript_107249/g.334314 Transcript_107249/m.334314 type:complete len:145 (+) Transcript_107249:417-851(+)